MRVFYLIVLISMVLAVVGFAMLNADPVPVNYFFGKVQWPLVVNLFVALCLGAVLAFLLISGPLLKTTLRCRHLQSQLQQVQKKLVALQEKDSRESL